MDVQKQKKTRRQSQTRTANIHRIIEVAEDHFARFGYNGAAIENIAEGASMSKQNMLYYFPSKKVLYMKVLENVLGLWIEKMVLLDQHGDDDPAAMLENYIRGKIELSRTHPNGSKVFANEIINGAPNLKEYLQSNLEPILKSDIELVQRWIAEGKIDPIDPYHLFFVVWSATQTYADFSTQIALLLKKPALDEQDFRDAGDFLVQVILKGIGAR